MREKSYKISMPLKVKLGRQEYIVNLNQYRNWHYHVMNGVKKNYHAMVAKELCSLPPMNKIRLEFKLFKGSLRRTDRANVLSIHEKFFCDALTKCSVIEDDNDDCIESTLYTSGGLDRKNPRVEIIITMLDSSKVDNNRQVTHGR